MKFLIWVFQAEKNSTAEKLMSDTKKPRKATRGAIRGGILKLLNNLFDFTKLVITFQLKLFYCVVKCVVFTKKVAFNNLLKATYIKWLRELDLNQRPSGYEPDELPDCSIPRYLFNFQDT